MFLVGWLVLKSSYPRNELQILHATILVSVRQCVDFVRSIYVVYMVRLCEICCCGKDRVGCFLLCHLYFIVLPFVCIISSLSIFSLSSYVFVLFTIEMRDWMNQMNEWIRRQNLWICMSVCVCKYILFNRPYEQNLAHHVSSHCNLLWEICIEMPTHTNLTTTKYTNVNVMTRNMPSLCINRERENERIHIIPHKNWWYDCMRSAH